MKIRTSFVTNSSGSSSSRIVIENEELYTLLKKYTDDINNRLKEIDNSSIEIADIEKGIISDGSSYGDGIDHDSFWYYRGNASIKEIPSAYIKCLEKAIIDYDKDEIIIKIFDELKKELQEKEALINKSYQKIKVTSSYSGDGGSERNETLIDKENCCPKCGSTLIYKSCESGHGCRERGKEESLICKNPLCTYEIKVKIKEQEYDYDEELPFENNSYLTKEELSKIDSSSLF